MQMASDSKENGCRKKIVVLGGGSAGFLTALALKKHLADYDVTVVRSTKLGVIGVGEGTIWSVVSFLHRFLDIDETRFHQEVCPTYKLGIHYLWGPRPFFNYTFSPQFSRSLPGTDTPLGYFCHEKYEFADEASVLMTNDKACFRRPNGTPQMVGSYAYHLENRRFVGFLEQLADEFGIEKIDAFVEGVSCDETGVKTLHLDGGQDISGDLFIDASGFRAELIGKVLGEKPVDFSNALFCNSAIFGGWERSDDEVIHPYTTAETMSTGWSWRIEHDQLVNRGYVYCSDFISQDDAEKEFRDRNPAIKETQHIKFRTGALQNPWVKNVIAVGNSVGFVEPLEATAIAMICDSAIRIVRALKATGGEPNEVVATAYNRVQFENWEIIRDFLALHYRFNSRLDTPFWNACVNDVPLGRIEPLVEFYQEVGPDLEVISVEMKRDFFDIEGYLSMLIGQQVAYKRQVNFSLKEKNLWRAYKSNLGDLIYNAMDMRELLNHVRKEDGTAKPPRRPFRLSDDSIGELQWH